MAEFWSTEDDAEYLSHTDIAGALRAFRDERGEVSPDQLVRVFGFSRMQPKPSDCGRTLYNVLETLDEEFGDPQSLVATTPCQALLDAEKKFHETILEHYKVFMCERTDVRMVRFGDYVSE